MRQFLDQFDDEWTVLCRSPTGYRAVAAWAAAPRYGALWTLSQPRTRRRL